ncbi:GNAT family N-acetyltransferase [Maribacter sp.]|nr:GNAT family N-acetyltransferase [Maribacter sp.]
MDKDFLISTDKSLLNIDFIHEFIRDSYWGQGRTMEQTKKTIENSFCFGMYSKSRNQIGFARVVTDYAFFGYFMDVIIAPEYQGKGLGKVLVDTMLANETIQILQTVALKTKDAHELYEKFGFKKIVDSPLWMSIDRQKLK